MSDKYKITAFMLALLIPVMCFGAGEIENWSNTQNGTLRMNRVSTGVNSVEADTFIGNLTGDVTGGVTGDVTCDDINASGANTATLDFNMGADTNVTMSTITYKQSTPAANIEDGDKRVVVKLNAYNDATQAVDYVTVEYVIDDASDTSEDASMIIKAYKAGTVTTLATIDASGIDAGSGDVSGSTIGSIAEANLLDKSATETVGGAYTFTNASISMTQLPTSTSGLASGRLWLNSNVLTVVP